MSYLASEERSTTDGADEIKIFNGPEAGKNNFRRTDLSDNQYKGKHITWAFKLEGEMMDSFTSLSKRNFLPKDIEKTSEFRTN